MFEEMIQRAELRNILEFIQHGVEAMPAEPQSLETKVKSAQKLISRTIDERFTERKERDTVEETINFAIGDIENGFFEAGFKAGANALFNILK